MHYAPLSNLRYVCVIVNMCSSFIYALAISEEKTVNAVKALNLAMLVMGGALGYKD